MKIFITLLFFLVSQLSIAQCPTTVQLTSAQKCARLIWPTPPSPLPAYIIYNAVQFNYVSGAGTAASPAEYKDPAASGACSSYSGANSDITLPSGQVCSYSGGTLPLQWLALGLQTSAINQVSIQWEVQESSVKVYTVQTSADGINFYDLATVNSKGDGINKYTYTHQNNLQTTTYYRVKQVSNSGSITYSSILKHYKVKQKNSLTIYPNPAKTTVTLTTANQSNVNSVAKIIDLQGKVVGTFYLQSKTQMIDISTYESGLYTLQLKDGSASLLKIVR